MTLNNAFAARKCVVGVVVTNESNVASYFPEAGNLNGSSADMCWDVAGPSTRGSDDLFEPSNETDPGSLNRATHYWPPSWISARLQLPHCLSGPVTCSCISSFHSYFFFFITTLSDWLTDNSRHILDQSEAKPKSSVSCSRKFSRSFVPATS